MSAHYKHPRLYVDQPLQAGKTALLDEGQAHYLKNVLRRAAGDSLRLFNARDGEWLGELQDISRKSAVVLCRERLRQGAMPARRIHLFFPPLAKDRLDFLIEKAVELGATDLHPVITDQSDIRKLNAERIAAQIIEAAEQCERLDIPALYDIKPLDRILKEWDATIPLYAALERTDSKPLSSAPGDCALLIGPPGGFSGEEKSSLQSLAFVHPVILTKNILRSETAALFGLSILRNIS